MHLLTTQAHLRHERLDSCHGVSSPGPGAQPLSRQVHDSVQHTVDSAVAHTYKLAKILSTLGVELELGGALLPNNSLVDPSNINETNSLICQGEEVVWTLPNGTVASDYQIDNTSLGWSNDTEVPSGLYSCSASNDSAYVGIYSSTDSTNNGACVRRGACSTE